MKNLVLFILSLTFALQATASDNVLAVLDQTKSVFTAKDNAISLEQAKELAVGENIDVKIAYERLFQTQRKIGQARASYFPYGVGDAIAIYYTNAFSSLILIELATSIPTKWYNVQKEKHLRNAEAYNLKALRENIKNQVALIYYSILKEESLMTLTAYELTLMEELIVSTEAQVALGMADAKNLESLKYRTLSLRDEFLKFEAYLAEEKTAFKMLLNIPYTAKVVLQPVGKFLKQNDFSIDKETLATMAQIRSFEVKSAQAMINAAYDAKNSTKWSILSFGGIGFGYMANIRSEGSKVNESIFRKQAVTENVYNNTYTRERMFRNSVDFFLSEMNIMNHSKGFMMSQIADFKVGNIAVSEVIESELYYLRDFREMMMAHYNALIRLDDLERVVLGKVNGTEFQADDFQIAVNTRRRSTTLSILADINMYDVQSVTYTIEGKSFRDIKSFSAKRYYRVKLKNKYLTFPIKGSALIILKNGEVIKKKF